MSEWLPLKVKDFGKIVTGKTPSTKNQNLYNGETPFICIPDLGNSKRIFQTSKSISDLGKRLHLNQLIPAEAVMVSCIATIGKVGITVKESLTNQQINSIIPNQEIVNVDFIYYLFINEGDNIGIYGGGGSVFNIISKAKFSEIEFQIPPKEEQQAIAEVLSSIDDKIDLLNSQNETLEAMVQTLFRQWFIEEADDSWEEKRLDEICTVSIGKTPPRKEPQWFSTETGIPWLSIKDMGNSGVYTNGTSEYLTKGAIQKFNVKVIPEGAVVLSFKLTIGRVSITAEDMCTNEAIAHFYNINNQYSNNHFIYLFLKQFNFNSLGSTSSIAEAVNSKTVKGIKIIVPTIDRLDSFESFVKPMFDKISSNTKMISTLTLKRDTLLPKLMSGEVRIKLD